jgi:hypothetical protein
MNALAPIEAASGLSIYERMCFAIAECVAVDEAKDIRDKAAALEAYYRQARNLDAEREAANVRLRAERRVGELLKELDRAETPNPSGIGGKSNKVVTSTDATQQSPYAAALKGHGMSRQTASRYQALATIPKETFERALSAPEKPTTAGVLRHVEARKEVRNPAPSPKVSNAALTLWGQLRDFERMGFLGADMRPAMASMTDAMLTDVKRLVPLVKDLLEQLEATYEPA